jgi:DNA-binding transcriptional regulator LsrR (DeoR family)
LPDVELDLATRAAWLSFVGGHTQEEISARLGVSRVKVTRLIAQATQAGLVHVFVDGPAVACIALEEEIKARWRLGLCTVALNVDEAPLPLASLAAAGAHFLHRQLEGGSTRVIGVGHGRTLAAAVGTLPRVPRPGLRFVSLIGSLTRRSAANPFDVIHRLTEITGAEGYFMPAPFFADSIEDKQVLMAQKSIRAVMALAHEAALHVVGIGEVAPSSHLVAAGMINEAEHKRVREAGAVGEVLGCFVGPDGRPVDAEVNERGMAVPLADLAGRQVIAIAGGRGKAAAIAAVLESRVITGLITDEATARELVAMDRRPESRPQQQAPDKAA